MCARAATSDALRMDANEARRLRRTTDQQEHWAEAEAVRDGHQAARDPDASSLVELGDARRRYRASDGYVYTKQLVNGRWAYFF
jgi:hypothetical protein